MLLKEWRENRKRKAALKEKRLEQERKCEGERAHYYLLRLVDEHIKNRTIKDQLLLLNYMIDSMLDDVCANTVIEPLIGRVKGHWRSRSQITFLMKMGINSTFYLTKQFLPIFLKRKYMFVRGVTKRFLKA